MVQKPVARVGDTGSHGGTIITGSNTIFAEDKPVALVGDICDCPVRGPNPIVTGALSVFGNDGRPMAPVGSQTACGAVITSGAPTVTLDDSVTHSYSPTAQTYAYSAAAQPTISSAPGSENRFQNEDDVDSLLTVLVKNADANIDEKLGFHITVSKVGYPDGLLNTIDTQDVPYQQVYEKKLEAGNYHVFVRPNPPDGEELGPVPYNNGGKFEKSFRLVDGIDRLVEFSVTRKEAIERNIMMTFLVEGVEGGATGEEPGYEFSSFSYNHEARDAIQTNAAKFSLDADLVNAILYMETTHGYYDRFFDYLPAGVGNEIHKSIRPMNVNVIEW